jgi:hypothetical protein
VVSKFIDEPITVHVSKEFKPTAFIWRKRLYRVIDVLYWWREPAEWWNGEPVRLLIRVSAECRSQGTYELRKSDSGWYLYRMLD